ncbi:hypothetical protein DL93DRAFT_2225124 [Clavulina sp. PMI_390]|nr:hypothetical protein DL93DRAFT_2225124 [Clavulina sp. PMI_390]
MMSFLPHSIVYDILLFLPGIDVVRNRVVARMWRDITHHSTILRYKAWLSISGQVDEAFREEFDPQTQLLRVLPISERLTRLLGHERSWSEGLIIQKHAVDLDKHSCANLTLENHIGPKIVAHYASNRGQRIGLCELPDRFDLWRNNPLDRSKPYKLEFTPFKVPPTASGEDLSGVFDRLNNVTFSQILETGPPSPTFTPSFGVRSLDAPSQNHPVANLPVISSSNSFAASEWRPVPDIWYLQNRYFSVGYKHHYIAKAMVMTWDWMTGQQILDFFIDFPHLDHEVAFSLPFFLKRNIFLIATGTGSPELVLCLRLYKLNPLNATALCLCEFTFPPLGPHVAHISPQIQACPLDQLPLWQSTNLVDEEGGVTRGVIEIAWMVTIEPNELELTDIYTFIIPSSKLLQHLQGALIHRGFHILPWEAWGCYTACFVRRWSFVNSIWNICGERAIVASSPGEIRGASSRRYKNLAWTIDVLDFSPFRTRRAKLWAQGVSVWPPFPDDWAHQVLVTVKEDADRKHDEWPHYAFARPPDGMYDDIASRIGRAVTQDPNVDHSTIFRFPFAPVGGELPYLKTNLGEVDAEHLRVDITARHVVVNKVRKCGRFPT